MRLCILYTYTEGKDGKELEKNDKRKEEWRD